MSAKPVLNIGKAFSKREFPWDHRSVNGDSLEYQALTSLPTATDLDLFEKESRRSRQIVIGRLQNLEQEINLKTLPVITAIVTVTAAVVGLSLASTKTEVSPTAPPQNSVYDLYLLGVILFVALAAVIILIFNKRHVRKEACLTAWTTAFKDSHSYRLKVEENENTAGESSEPALFADADSPSDLRYSWMMKIFG